MEKLAVADESDDSIARLDNSAAYRIDFDEADLALAALTRLGAADFRADLASDCEQNPALACFFDSLLRLCGMFLGCSFFAPFVVAFCNFACSVVFSPSVEALFIMVLTRTVLQLKWQ